jgi:toxin HigB-1
MLLLRRFPAQRPRSRRAPRLQLEGMEGRLVPSAAALATRSKNREEIVLAMQNATNRGGSRGINPRRRWPHPVCVALLTAQATRLDAIAFDGINASRYHARMIRSFRDKETERIFLREPRTKLARPFQRAALRKLLMLHAAVSLNDLLVPPGNRLEKLSGDREGQYSIRINDQWRICFEWVDGDAHKVEIVDYH